MSSGTSTERRSQPDTGFQLWQFYLLLSMLGATVAVMLSRETHPTALLLLSTTSLGAGLAALALHRALAGFWLRREAPPPLAATERQTLEAEKALALRAIKELEFDRAMGKISDADFQALGGRLRARALSLMEALDAAAASKTGRAAERRNLGEGGQLPPACPSCGTPADADARFCKNCGTALGPTAAPA
jgi:hypothetical protein